MGAESEARGRFTIREVLLLYAGALLIASMIVYGVAAFGAARAALLGSIHEQLADDAVTVRSGLEELVTAHAQNVRTWSDLSIMRELVIRDLDKSITRFLDSVKRDYGVYLDLFAVDAAGVCVAASDADAVGRDCRLQIGLAAGRPASVETIPVAIVRSPAHRSWALRLVAPIADPDSTGRELGVLVAFFDVAVLDRVVVAKPGHGHVELRLLDGASRVIAGHDADAAKPPTPWILTGSARPTSDELGLTPVVRNVRDAIGRELVVAEAAVFAGGPLARMGWRLIAAAPTADALAPVTVVRDRVLVAGTLLISLGILIAGALAARIARPVDELTAVATRIAGTGAFEPIPARSSVQELARLALAFDKMVEAVAAAQEELVRSSKLAFLGELAAGMAHEIRTPLGIIRNSAQLLERRLAAAGDVEAGEWAVFIREESDRLNGVVSQLLDLARPAPLDKAHTDLGELTARTASLLAPEAQTRGVALELRTEAGLPQVLCDAPRIQQVCLNLVMNALQASQPGDDVVVETRRSAVPDSVEIVVSDRGAGIAPELLERLFEPFVTKRAGGIGLGLAIVRRIVLAHGGEVSARNRAEGGAEFVVRLPVNERATGGAT